MQRFDGLGNYRDELGRLTEPGTVSSSPERHRGRLAPATCTWPIRAKRPDQEFDASGSLLTQWSTSNPTGVAVDSSDVIHVAGNNNIYPVQHLGRAASRPGRSPGGRCSRRWNGQHLGHDDGERDRGVRQPGRTLLGTYGSGVLSAPSRSRSRREARSTSPTPATGGSAGSPVPVLPRSSGASIRAAGFPTCRRGSPSTRRTTLHITKKATDQIQKFDVDGNLLAEFGGTGNTDGKLNDPSALAVRTGRIPVRRGHDQSTDPSARHFQGLRRSDAGAPARTTVRWRSGGDQP